MRALCLLVLLVAGCDALRADDSLAGDTLTVALARDDRGLVLTTERRYDCLSLDVATRRAPGQLEISVQGLRSDPLADCALEPVRVAKYVSFEPDDAFPLDVRIRHRGAVDEYRVVAGIAGLGLQTVRARVTRAGAPV